MGKKLLLLALLPLTLACSSNQVTPGKPAAFDINQYLRLSDDEVFEALSKLGVQRSPSWLPGDYSSPRYAFGIAPSGATTEERAKYAVEYLGDHTNPTTASLTYTTPFYDQFLLKREYDGEFYEFGSCLSFHEDHASYFPSYLESERFHGITLKSLQYGQEIFDLLTCFGGETWVYWLGSTFAEEAGDSYHYQGYFYIYAYTPSLTSSQVSGWYTPCGIDICKVNVRAKLGEGVPWTELRASVLRYVPFNENYNSGNFPARQDQI